MSGASNTRPVTRTGPGGGITLANIRAGRLADLGHYLETHNLLRLPEIAVDRFQLVQSYLTRAGSIYEAASEYPLA